MTAIRIAKIAVSGTSFGYDKPYTYQIPDDLDDCSAGARVLIPFGSGNRKRIGLVLQTEDAEELQRIKPIFAVIDNASLLSGELLEMVSWLKETTLCTFFEAYKTIIPSGLHINFTQRYELTGTTAENLSAEEAALLMVLSGAKNRKEFDALLDTTVNAQKKKLVKSLLEKGVISEVDDLKRGVKDEIVRMLRLSDSYVDAGASPTLSTKQRVVVTLLEQNSAASVKEVCYLCNVTPAVILGLKKKDIVTEYALETVPFSDATSTERVEDITLTEEQQRAFDGIKSLLDAGKPCGALLFGITGSGKTSVFVKLIDYVLKRGQQAVMLIPEIALTPQMVGKFQSLFGETVAVIHSNLSMSGRLNEYKRIRSGGARIVVGTRSAVFAPLENIGIFIMDEEGERSYKSEAAPRYHAREIAKKRCLTHGATLLMASATPSVESFYYAQNGRYSCFELTKRYSDAQLPAVTIVDMGEEMARGNSSFFSDVLADEICYNLEHGEQTLLLLNRRGYHTYISCPQCREPIVCPNCSIAMTYHRANGQLMCHYCGYARAMDKSCPKCGCEHLKQDGVGTQRIEDEIAKAFPTARLLRMDADTTYSRYAYEKNFTAFGNGEYDILIGTQMIAKGLDFPNVTLVGVISVDKALFAGDFRSYERTFSLITQVVGRGGRGGKPGRAFLQTNVPDHYVLNLAAKQDYKGFFGEEIAMRKALIYPPFCDICVVGFTSLLEKKAEAAAENFLTLMKLKVEKEQCKFPLRVMGPSKCIFEKIGGKYRYRIILKCRNSPEFREFVGSIWAETFHYKEFSNVTVFIDMNGDIV